MARFCIICVVALCATYCTSEGVETAATTQAGSNVQGRQLQGMQLQGMQLQGVTMQGFQFDGATLNGSALTHVRIEHGELVAEQGQVTLHGTDLVNAYLVAQVHAHTAPPGVTTPVAYQITGVEAEDPAYDPTHTGATFLYTLEQRVDQDGSWQAACPTDLDGRSVAIPLTATWNDHGDRVESTSMFTFGCTTGVIAKCYRWGYRPWVTGYGDLAMMHWVCTRAARADYCGNGVPHTRDGTTINVWDNLGAPGPIQAHGSPPLGMIFEAGWSTGGAVCFSHARWLLGGPIIALGCPDRLLAPGLGILGGTVCDDVAHVLGQPAIARMFDESYLSINLDVF